MIFLPKFVLWFSEEIFRLAILIIQNADKIIMMHFILFFIFSLKIVFFFNHYIVYIVVFNLQKIRKIGLKTSNLPHDVISTIENEEQLAELITE